MPISRKTALLSVCAAGAMLAGMANAAQAQVVINGGGSTLAALLYQQEFGVSPPAPGTPGLYQILGNPTTVFNFNPDGSGKGQSAFLTNNPLTHGYPAGATVHYGASDATLSSAQIDAYNNANPAKPFPLTGQKAVAGPIVQIPTFATAIAIGFHVRAKGGDGALQFTDSQLCGIFSGKINNWTDPALAGSNTNGRFPPTGTIKVVYRTDGSGTSFLLTQHLAAPGVCSSATSNVTFSATANFNTLFPGGTVPGNFVGGNGSGGVASAIMNPANGNTIGYISPDYTHIAPGNSSNTLFVAAVKNATTGAFVLPSIANTVAALAGAPAPSTPAQLADPTQFVPAVANPSSGYPIAGFTTFDLAQCYRDANVGNEIINFLSAYYAGGAYASNLNQAGFASIPSQLAAAITDNLLANNLANDLDIQSGVVCQSAGASGPGTYAGR